MIETTISRARDTIWRVWAAPTHRRPAEPASAGRPLPRAGSSRPETSHLLASIICAAAIGSLHGCRSGSRRKANPGAGQAACPALLVCAGADLADADCRRRGPLLLGLRRQPLPRLRLAARQRLDRPSAPEG